MLVLYCYLTRVVFTTGCTVIMNCKLIVDQLIGTVPHIRTRVVHVYKPEKYYVTLIQVGNKNTLLIYYKLKPLGERERENPYPTGECDGLIKKHSNYLYMYKETNEHKNSFKKWDGTSKFFF